MKWFLGAVALFLMPINFAFADAMTLQDAWVQAYQNNPTLEAERAKLRVTDEQVNQALSHWRPSADVNASVGKTYQYIPAQKPFGTQDFADTTRSYGIQVTQPLFRGFRTLSETEAAEKQVRAGRAKLQSAEEQLLLDTATSYLDAIRDETILDLDHNYESVLKDKLNETNVRADKGDLTQTDVQQSQSRLARAQISRLQIENALNADRSAFARLVGDAPGTLVEPTLPLEPPQELDDALQSTMSHNPTIISAQYAVDEAKAEVDLNKGSLLPEINLVGSSSTSNGESSTLPGRFDSSQILAQMTMPLYRSGADYSRIRAALQTVTQRRMELEDARRHAHEIAQNAWQALQIAEAAIKADTVQVEAASRALEGVKVQSQIGTRTTIDALNAEQELLDAKIDMARAEHDKTLSLLQLRAAIGELTADSLKLPVEIYNPKKHYNDVRSTWIGFGQSDDVYAVHARDANKD